MLLASKSRGALALLGGALLYASFGVLIREISKMFGASMQTAVRFALAALVILLLNMLLRKALIIPRLALIKAVTLGVSMAAVVILFTVAVNNTTLATSVCVLYAGSLSASFAIGTWVLKETVTANKVLALGCALVGLVVYNGDFGVWGIGALAALGAGLFESIANTARKSLGGVDRGLVQMYQFSIGAVVALIALIFSPEQAVRQVSIGPIVATAIFVVLMLCLGNLLLYGFQHFDVNVGTIILATELFFAAALGYVFFREVPSPSQYIGGLLIFAASAAVALDMSSLRRIIPRKH